MADVISGLYDTSEKKMQDSKSSEEIRSMFKHVFSAPDFHVMQSGLLWDMKTASAIK